MTPKEKAKSIVRLFEPHARIVVNPGETVGREAHAKQCALIAAELIYEEYAKEYSADESYWFKVKQEIQKL